MAANEKKQTIVIKKITVVAAGGHGGSWKVAFADFMTAMMAFFLVMWLVGQTPEVKKSVADYFSTPSIIEYNFSNFGVELTLEKLFLDLVNEPLKAFEQFVMPVDKRPNIMDMGLAKIQIHFLTEKLGEYTSNVQVSSDEITFEIAENYLFKNNSAEPDAEFAVIMENVKQIVEGLKDSDIKINSELPYIKDAQKSAKKNIAEERLDLVMNKVEQGLLHDRMDLFGKTTVNKISGTASKKEMTGYIKFQIRQKDKPKIRKIKPELNDTYETSESASDDVYENFVDKLTRKAEGKKAK
ncbi:MAG: chemotaxis protein MotB [Bdellovibrionales bacterium]|nr:chemotaxis protein MotB [Bdellovibrionales bacterium]